ncbi:hypothetical protein Mgra_00010224 [Meloidogyne graminicola]|uniref:Uncharacterized protein n=1 Tax=Meloidogyne graminicola TaxID=189291 RepID=A0A8S9Z857_9BILA|nr:hypothetical protein Mgra_00010222 [Meloidogyne graminicola]KAF7623477.1 hypothetical protein Mgra_00010224 [Meloidogyne graminicola]
MHKAKLLHIRHIVQRKGIEPQQRSLDHYHLTKITTYHIPTFLNDPKGISIVDREHRGRIRFTDESGLPVMNAKTEDSSLRFTEIPKITLADTNLKKSGIDASDLFLQMFKIIS